MTTSHTKTTVEIVTALIAALTAVRWSGEAAFQSVRRYDSDDLERAFRELLIYQQRIAMVVPLAESFESEARGSQLLIRRIRPFGLVFSDRVLGKREDSIFGSSGTPGAYGLLEAALPAVAGQIIDNPNGVRSEPTSAQSLTLADAEAKLPSRAAVLLELECRGGWYDAPLNLGPTR